jgi:hypothetical protein
MYLKKYYLFEYKFEQYFMVKLSVYQISNTNSLFILPVINTDVGKI